MNDKAKAVGDDWISALPTVYTQIQKAIDDPESTFKAIGDIIASDVALTSRLLKIVNSSFYGFSEPVETITHALNIIGTMQLNDLVLATSVIQQFPGVLKDLISMDSFWRHSIAVGLASRELAQDASIPGAERFYVAGMLHDVGSLVIFKKMPKRSEDILAQCQSQNLPLHEVERKCLGFDHTIVGESLLKAWGIPNRLVESVACHHNPEKAQQYPVETAVLHVADIVAYDINLSTSRAFATPSMDKNAWDLIGLPESDLDLIKEKVNVKFNEVASMFLAH